MKGTKILIISDLFYPSSQIGAQRATKMAKYLKMNGVHIDVYTRYDAMNDKDISKYCDGLFFYENPMSQEVIGKSSGKQRKKTFATRVKHYFSGIYRTVLSLHRGNKLKKHFVELLGKEINGNDYDAVFSTFGPMSSLWCGRCFKKKYPDVKWICDFRDPVVVEMTPKLFRPYFSWIQNNACKKADAIITVSNGYLDRICKNRYKSKSYMIPNGYDIDEMCYSDKIIPSNNILRITYVGAMYEGKRDLSPIFKAVGELCDSGSINANRIELCYAGTDFAFFSEQAKPFNLENCVKDLGRLQRKECLELQFSSHFLMLATWNGKKEYGVFPGKFLEYMLIGKPIISVVDGDKANSEVSEVIESGNLGISYEAARAGDYIKLRDYIKRQYVNFTNNGFITFSPNCDVVEKYNYNNIIEQVRSVING